MADSNANPSRRQLLGVLAAPMMSALAALGCNQLFYLPSRTLRAPLRDDSRPFYFRSRDGTKLRGWHVPSQTVPVKGTVVQFHGNAGNISTHIRSVNWLTRRGYDLMLFDYRGYGASEGWPSPQGLHEDALAALDFAERQLPQTSRHADLVLLGQSLGGAILLRALAERRQMRRVRHIVVESSFHSYQEVAASVAWRTPLLFPFTGVGYGLVSDEYAPAAHIAGLSPWPLLFVHGLADEVISPEFSLALYTLSRPPRCFLTVPHVGHQAPMATCAEAYREAYLRIIEHADHRSCPQLDVQSVVCEALPSS